MLTFIDVIDVNKITLGGPGQIFEW